MMKVFITNLAKYNEGILIGEWIELPTDEDELKEKIKEILGDDEEFFITDYEGDIEYRVHEYENVFELNEHLEQIKRINDNDLVNAILRSTGNDLEEVIDIIEDGRYICFKGVIDEEELGRMIVDEGLFGFEISEQLYPYIDFKKIGEDWYMDIYDDLKLAISIQ